MANPTKGTTTTRSRSKTSAAAKATSPAPAKNPTKAATAVRKPSNGKTPRELSAELRREMIAEAAYLRAERRGFSAGDPTEDWLEAEREVDLLLAERPGQVTQ
ncbi:MAG: DUF2934 domain-containing protein [Thiohalobacteraceae bacterium]